VLVRFPVVGGQIAGHTGGSTLILRLRRGSERDEDALLSYIGQRYRIPIIGSPRRTAASDLVKHCHGHRPATGGGAVVQIGEDDAWNDFQGVAVPCCQNGEIGAIRIGKMRKGADTVDYVISTS